MFVTFTALIAGSCVADAILRDLRALGGPDFLMTGSFEDRWIARLIGAPLPFWIGIYVIGRLPRSRVLLERVLIILALILAAHAPYHLFWGDRSFGVLELIVLIAAVIAVWVTKGARFKQLCAFYEKPPLGR